METLDMSSTDLPKVTIAIPTYNRAEHFLPKALESALAQDYPALEIIVSDNASSDSTEALLGSLNDERLHYVRQKVNLGATGNFEFCENNATGDYFLLLHDDDMIDPDFVSSCMKAANYRKDIGLIRTGTRIIDEKGVVQQNIPNVTSGFSLIEYYGAWFSGQSAWYLCSDLFNTKLLKEVGGIKSPHHMLPDGVAITRLCEIAPRVDIEEIKASFRKHAGELTFTATAVADWCADYIYLRELMCAQVGNSEEFRKAATRRFARTCMQLARAKPNFWGRLQAKVNVALSFGWKSWV